MSASIAATKRYARMNPERRAWVAAEVYARDGWRCAYCGVSHDRTPERLTLDHLIPRGHGGPHYLSNLVAACDDCNQQRGDRPLTTWLAVMPRDLAAKSVLVVLAAIGDRGDATLRAAVEALAAGLDAP